MNLNSKLKIEEAVRELFLSIPDAKSEATWIYTLLLADGNYYVGKTQDLKHRLRAHKNNDGSAWSKLHHPVSLVGLVQMTAPNQETILTLKMMKQYGVFRVRGGPFTATNPDVLKMQLKKSTKAMELLAPTSSPTVPQL